MKKSTYLRIKKDYIVEDSITSFDLFEVSEDKKKMSHFLEKGKIINRDDIDKISKSRDLYILSNTLEEYQNYCSLYIRAIAKSTTFSFEEKSSVLYDKAEEVMDQLFEDPESVGKVDKVKDIVDDMLYIILDEDFTIESMMTLATHDYYTHTHSMNVSMYSLSLGYFLNFSKEQLEELGEAALLHDIGKSKVDPSIINKNGKLDDDEFLEIMNHPAWGQEIAQNLGVTNKKVLFGIRHHHEKLDGSGYPDGIRGDSIPQYARIIGICDVFDALTTNRSYKEPMRSFDALKLIKNSMQNHLDMGLVDSMIKMLAQTA